MKKKAFYALACVLYLTGCSTPEADEKEVAQKRYPIQFSIQLQKEVISFPPTRSMPPNPIQEPHTSKTENPNEEESELFTRIEYLVFNHETTPTLVKHRQYAASDAGLDMDFGIVYDSLPQGNYTFHFLAHTSEKAVLSGSTLAFDKVSDTFHATENIEIGWAANINKDIELQRIVSQIEFKATDTVPNQIARFEMTVQGWPDQFDLSTGKGVINHSQQLLSHLFTPQEVGKQHMTHAFYTFLPPGDEKISVQLAAIDKNNLPIRKRNIGNITPERNKIICYSGRLYSHSESDNTFQLTIFNNGKWEDKTEIELPEQ